MSLELVEIPTESLGNLKVYVQGDWNHRETVFLTCHDLGNSHESLVDYVNEPAMKVVAQDSVFLHVCLPGQGLGDADLPADFAFPSLDKIGEELVKVLDRFNIRLCIAMGEGAGANILCRFALFHPNRCLGLVLIHCTSTTAGVMEYINDKMINRKLSSAGMHQGAFDYLTEHKFGVRYGMQAQRQEKVAQYLDNLKNKFNAKNVGMYLDSFLRRTDLSKILADDLKVDALLVVGSKASHLHTVHTMHKSMRANKATLLQLDDVGDVMLESPDRLARALILFCKGLGALGKVPIPGMGTSSASGTMEEADRPKRH